MTTEENLTEENLTEEALTAKPIAPAWEAQPRSLMLVRRGRIVAEGWWNPYCPAHALFGLQELCSDRS